MKSSIATIFSANIGGIDSPQNFVKQNVDVDTIIFQGEAARNRLISKYWKTAGVARNCHTPVAIWVDGSVDIIDKGFALYVTSMLITNDFIVAKHPDRKTLGEEYDYILDNIDKPYLKTRYAKEPWGEEMEYFEDCLDAPLVNPRFFALKINDDTTELLERWWTLIQRFTVFDQSQLTALLHENYYEVKYELVDWEELNKFLKVKKHKELK